MRKSDEEYQLIEGEDFELKKGKYEKREGDKGFDLGDYRFHLTEEGIRIQAIDHHPVDLVFTPKGLLKILTELAARKLVLKKEKLEN